MKTLENLENDYWPSAYHNSSKLVQKCHELRKIPIDRLEIDDLRVLISQGIGLKHLLPLALNLLEENILIEGDYYEGDLLMAVLSSDIKKWSDSSLIIRLRKVFENNIDFIKEADLTDEIRNRIFEVYNEFVSNPAVHRD